MARSPEDWIFDKHGIGGLLRAIVFMEYGEVPDMLYSGPIHISDVQIEVPESPAKPDPLPNCRAFQNR